MHCQYCSTILLTSRARLIVALFCHTTIQLSIDHANTHRRSILSNFSLRPLRTSSSCFTGETRFSSCARVAFVTTLTYQAFVASWTLKVILNVVNFSELYRLHHERVTGLLLLGGGDMSINRVIKIVSC